MDLNQSPGFLINKLAHMMQVELERRLHEFDVTTSQWAVLALLWKREGLSQVEIQQSLGLEKATVAGLVQRMSHSNLLYRETDTNDKRIQRVFLTVKGKQLENLLIPHAKAVNELALSGFSHEEKEIFMQFIKAAIRNLDSKL
jgi:DNA-binding MarR family transcriptional regulator